MNGGKIIWMVDMLEVNEFELVDTNITYARPLKHQLQQFLFKYGARFNVNMVNDIRCSPVLREDGLGRKHRLKGFSDKNKELSRRYRVF